MILRTESDTRRKDCPKRLCHNDLNCPQRLIFSCYSVIVDNFSHCSIVVYSNFSSSVMSFWTVLERHDERCGCGGYQ
jgi:hypothetical protein